MRKFSFVELLIVIAVLLILAAGVFAIFGRKPKSARKTLCMNYQRQLVIGVLMYAEDNNNELLYTGPNVRGPSLWCNRIAVYLDEDDGLYICPSGTAEQTCDMGGGRKHNYQMNSSRWVMGRGRNAAKLSRNSAPANTVVLADSQNDSGQHTIDHDRDPVPNGDISSTLPILAWRHQKQLNAVLLDGHVETAKKFEDTIGTGFYEGCEGGSAPWSWWGPRSFQKGEKPKREERPSQ